MTRHVKRTVSGNKISTDQSFPSHCWINETITWNQFLITTSGIQIKWNNTILLNRSPISVPYSKINQEFIFSYIWVGFIFIDQFWTWKNVNKLGCVMVWICLFNIGVMGLSILSPKQIKDSFTIRKFKHYHQISYKLNIDVWLIAEISLN